ncbi:MAG TPA: glycoside hydrolase family 15 protein [Methylocella sp.]|nr:glycoside hydrolase family 15 protein [Methylocella sp.]
METAGAAPGGEQRLSQWIERQYALSASLMLRAISATHLVKERPGFGQTIRPVRGSILASTALGAWDPDPDYFFHWLRDSAVVVDALRHLIAGGTHARQALTHCRDFVAFSCALNRLDGDAFLQKAGDFRKNVEPFFLQFVRDDGDFLSIKGDRVLGEPRFNPDATLDISKWNRPQHDGPAARALALMRLWAMDVWDEPERAAWRALIHADLDFLHRHWREPSFDIWEEELGQHYYTLLLHQAALMDGAVWAEQPDVNEASLAQTLRAAAGEIAHLLDEFWCSAKGYYLSRRNVTNGVSGKDLDFAVILAVNHAARKAGAHSVLDPRVMASFARLEDLFEGSYKINEGRPANLGPAMGRYADDHFFSGGAYYFSTLGAAEFYYALAEAVAAGADMPVAAENKEFLFRLGGANEAWEHSLRNQRELFNKLLERGDQFMATVEAFTPACGELSEQFDQNTGAQTSAKSLTWSHAAFISAATRRNAALRIAGPGLSWSLAPP